MLGYVPWQRKPAYLRRISMVLGNKSQMLWDIPPLDTFAVLGEMYGVPPGRVQQRTVDELVELLEMQELLTKPVRNLSLGERMKCELVAGLLHRPEVLSWTSRRWAWTCRCRPACGAFWPSTTSAAA